MLGNFSWFFVNQFFSKIKFFETFFRQYHQCQTAWIQISPEYLLNCLQRLLADNIAVADPEGVRLNPLPAPYF